MLIVNYDGEVENVIEYLRKIKTQIIKRKLIFFFYALFYIISKMLNRIGLMVIL